MTKAPTERDRSLEHAEEEAEGTALLESRAGGALEREREDAQGVEVFEDPDATLPISVLGEGSPGHELLTGDAVGLGRDDEDDREGREEEDG